MKQAPISYTKSIVEEIRIRFSLSSDSEVTTLLNRYKKKKEEQKNKGLRFDPLISSIESLFEKEPVKAIAFRKHYLPLLKLPDSIQIAIDKEEVKKTQVEGKL